MTTSLFDPSLTTLADMAETIRRSNDPAVLTADAFAASTALGIPDMANHIVDENVPPGFIIVLEKGGDPFGGPTMKIFQFAEAGQCWNCDQPFLGSRCPKPECQEQS